MSFNWITDFDGAEKAAMLVTANIDGEPVDLQFDTGSDVSGLFAISATDGGRQSFTAPVTLGEIQLGRQRLHFFSRPPGRAGGRLGLEALLGKIIKIDYPQQQICRLDEQQYAALAPQLLLTPARIRSKKLFLYIELNGDYWPGLFFDSGASLYHLLVDRVVWQRLTGRTGNEPDNHYLQGWSRNRLITTVGAPLRGKLSLTGLELQAPPVHFTRERPRHFADYPINVRGLIGNAPFFNRVIVLDLRGDSPWFGIKRQ